MKKAVMLEAINELHISDDPNLYKRIRRFARKYIKRQSVEPIDVINWPKGCLSLGLMEQALLLETADNSADRALSVYAFSEVKDYADRWIDRGSPIVKIDDCLFGQALLMLAEYFLHMGKRLAKMDDEKAAEGQFLAYDKYMQAADRIYEFLLGHDKDEKDCFPYRPAHKTGDIYADGVGMAAPFLIRYGKMRQNEDAIQLGMVQIKEFCANALDENSGLPFHTYSIKDEKKQCALGWGRAFGWLYFGVGAGIAGLCGETGNSRPEGFSELAALRELKNIAGILSKTAETVMRADGLFGSDLTNPDSPIDTSASAMILYGMKMSSCLFAQDSVETTEGQPKKSNSSRSELQAKISIGIDSLRANISEDGKVLNAQGECMGPGVYSENYDSYPWSVGMSLLLI